VRANLDSAFFTLGAFVLVSSVVARIGVL